MTERTYDLADLEAIELHCYGLLFLPTPVQLQAGLAHLDNQLSNYDFKGIRHDFGRSLN